MTGSGLYIPIYGTMTGGWFTIDHIDSWYVHHASHVHDNMVYDCTYQLSMVQIIVIPTLHYNGMAKTFEHCSIGMSLGFNEEHLKVMWSLRDSAGGISSIPREPRYSKV